MYTNLYGQLQKHAENHYASKLIAAHVIVIKRTKSEQAQQNVKHKLFLMLGKLVVKAINNFNYLTRGVPKHKLLHTSEDIAIECYVTFDTCLRNIDISKVNKFYFFLNTALNRAIYRLYEKQYTRYFNVIDNTEENMHLLLNAGYHQHFDFSEVDLLDLSELELDVLKFKVEGGKINVFLKEHDIAGKEFYETVEKLKTKLAVIYKDEVFFHDFEPPQALA